MATALPANVNLIQLLAASPGTTIVGTEPLESVQSGTSVAFTVNQVLSFVQSNFSAGNLASISGLSVLGVIGTANATPAAIVGTTDQVLRVAQNGTAFGFGAINLATSAAVTGVLPVVDGGTGTAALASFAVLMGGVTSTAAHQVAAATTAGYPFVANGSASLASFQALALASVGVTGVLPVVNGGTNYTGGAWTAYGAAISGANGSLSGGTTGTATFLQVGKLVHFNGVVTVGTSTLTGVMSMAIPATPRLSVVAAAGREQGLSGVMFAIQATAGTTTANLITFNNGNVAGTTGAIYGYSGTYEAL